MNTKDDVKVFMEAVGHDVHENLQIEFTNQSTLYMDLIIEEFNELYDGFRQFDMVETADACADLIWVIQGLCHSLGIPIQKVWDEVARSNLSKISESGKVLKREDGKVMKPESYSPPNIKKVMYEDS